MAWTRAICPYTSRQTNTLLTQQLAFYLMTAAVSPSSQALSAPSASI